MSQEEEKFMLNRDRMGAAIRDFYISCQKIEINNEGFAEDVIIAISEATDGAVDFDDWYDD